METKKETLYAIQVGDDRQREFIKRKDKDGDSIIATTKNLKKAKETLGKIIDKGKIEEGRVVTVNEKNQVVSVIEVINGKLEEKNKEKLEFTPEEINLAEKNNLTLEGLEGDAAKDMKKVLITILNSLSGARREGIIARERSEFKRSNEFPQFLEDVEILEKTRKETERIKEEESKVTERILSYAGPNRPHLETWIRVQAGIIRPSGGKKSKRMLGIHKVGGLHERALEVLRSENHEISRITLAKKMGTTPGNIGSQLMELEEEGLITSRIEGNKKFVSLK